MVVLDGLLCKWTLKRGKIVRIPKKLYICRCGDTAILLGDVIRRCKVMGTGSECDDCRGEAVFGKERDRKPKKKVSGG